MSGRSILSRPRRTKVYDCNYTAGESYYRPVVDSLDKKYSTPSVSSSSIELPAARRSLLREDADSRSSTLLDDYDSIFDSRPRSHAAVTRAMQEISNDEISQDVSESLKKIRASRARAREIEDEFSSSLSRRKGHDSFSDKLLDSMGLDSSSRSSRAHQDDSSSSVITRRVIKMTSSSENNEADGGSMSRWSALNSADEDDSTAPIRRKARSRLAELEAEEDSGAVLRARKSRARLVDLENEMDALAERGAVRDKRAAQLRALVAENDSEAQPSNSSLRVKKTTSTRTEKKTVTF